MSETQALTLPLGERFRWISFFVKHANLVPALLDLYQEWQVATTPEAKGEVLKALIGLIVGVWSELPLGEAMIEGDVEQLCVGETATLELRLGDGALLKRLLENLPQIIQVITVLGGLLGK